MHIIDARHLTDNEIKKYKGDVRTLLTILNNGKKLLIKPDKLLKVKYRKTLHVLSKLLNDDRYFLMAESMPEELKEEMNMCELMDALETRGEEKFALLAEKLLESNRIDELRKVIKDKSARKYLFQEFGLK